MNFFKFLYYWWIRHRSISHDGSHLSKRENIERGQWVVEYPDGDISKPCFWDVAYFRAIEEPGSYILYIGPHHEELRYIDRLWKSSEKDKIVR